ncbi:MAG TPA: HAD-IA family hydrolase [Methylomirabilota bacterium]
MDEKTARRGGLVLFDLDGTLVDTTDLILQSFEYTFERHLPGRLPPRDELIATFGRSLPETLRELAAGAGVPDPVAFGDTMLDTYREFQHRHHDRLIRSIPGVEEALAAMAAGGRRLGLVTSKMEPFARRGLRLFGLERYFEVAVFHGDTELHKPDPAPLLLAASRAGAPPEQTIYIGDSIHDIAAGRAAGMRTAAVLWGPFDPAVLLAAGPDLTVAHPTELTDLEVGGE